MCTMRPVRSQNIFGQSAKICQQWCCKHREHTSGLSIGSILPHTSYSLENCSELEAQCVLPWKGKSDL